MKKRTNTMFILFIPCWHSMSHGFTYIFSFFIIFYHVESQLQSPLMMTRKDEMFWK